MTIKSCVMRWGRAISFSRNSLRSKVSYVEGLPRFLDENVKEGEDILIPWKPAISPTEDHQAGEDEEESEEEENNLSEAAYRLIGRRGRVPYHHSPPLPRWLTDKQKIITSYRTTAQLRRCLKSWMLPIQNYEEMQKFRQRPLKWHTEAPSHEHKLSQSVSFGAEETAAYAQYFLPSVFTITRRVLEEASLLSPSFSPKRVLDFGCGVGTAGAAFLEVFGDNVEKYVGLDHSKAMLEAAKIVTGGRVRDRVFLSRVSELLRLQGRFDLVLCTYTLSTLQHDPARRAAVQLLYELLDEGGALFLLEEGSPRGSQTIRTARQFILDIGREVDKNGKVALIESAPAEGSDGMTERETVLHMMLPPIEGRRHDDYEAQIVAPCTHDKPCPLRPGLWCSFSQRTAGSIIRKDNEEKFSYVVVRKIRRRPTCSSSPPLTAAATSESFDITRSSPRQIFQWLRQQEAVGLLERALVDIDEVDWAGHTPLYGDRAEYARIVRSPLKQKGHVVFDLCTPEGELRRYTHSRSSLHGFTGLYTSMRKANWGGLLPYFIESHNSSFNVKQQEKNSKEMKSGGRKAGEENGGEGRTKRFTRAPLLKVEDKKSEAMEATSNKERSRVEMNIMNRGEKEKQHRFGRKSRPMLRKRVSAEGEGGEERS